METITNADKAKELVAKFERSVFLSKNYTFEMCIEEAMRWKDEQNTEFLVELKNAFESLTQMCDKLTSGNVAHQRPHLKGFARGWAEIIDEHLEKKGE